jgi:hypothetical protein
VTGAFHRVPLIGIRQSMVDRARAFYAQIERQRTRLASYVSQGRPVGTVAGTWVTDCAEIRQCVLLCSFCDHKFKPAHKRYGYHRDTKFTHGVGGQCDGCRVNRDDGLQLYIHETYIGQSYSPR